MDDKQEIEAYLARIRKTIADSENLVAQADLRIAETDRLLASQGLTREEVMKWHPTKEQRLAVNEELHRLGLPPLEEDDASLNFDDASAELRNMQQFMPQASSSEEDVVSDRQRKFGNFMRQYRL